MQYKRWIHTTPRRRGPKRTTYQVVQLLLEKGACVNQAKTVDSTTSIHRVREEPRSGGGAAASLRRDRCESSLEEPLYIACQNGHEAVVRLLAHDKIDVTLSLWIACFHGHEAVVKQLLAHDAIDVNQVTTDLGFTLYTLHARRTTKRRRSGCYYDAIDVNQAMTTMVPPLFMACQKGHKRWWSGC